MRKHDSAPSLGPSAFAAKPQGKDPENYVCRAPLPEGRESVYWMNLEAITAVDKDSIQNKSVLQLAVLSRIKMLVRPGGAAFKSSSRFADDHESHALFRHAGQFHDGCEKTA
ncbi:hypothetical protein AU509_10595 [Lonsdalea britannica]|uniref:fimbria/pilus periplasmic chaperone n=1 Tax=Lonsdalea britannica TaxID=1082704 RepID=UPI000A217A0A|nr:hypothetical protein AU509_10595 [Lonsdalea britannica]